MKVAKKTCFDCTSIAAESMEVAFFATEFLLTDHWMLHYKQRQEPDPLDLRPNLVRRCVLRTFVNT
jgi:hypothetical protein